jgi:hypothetical protein
MALLFRWLNKTTVHAILPWLLATLLVALTATVITKQTLLFIGWQKVIWLSVEVNRTDQKQPPPSILVSYNGENSISEPLLWENNGDFTYVGIRTLSDKPINILRIDTNKGQVLIENIKISTTMKSLTALSTTIISNTSGTLQLPETYHTITFTLQAGTDQGIVELMWFEQSRLVDLSAQPPGPYQIQFKRSVTYRGRVMLPPKPIEEIYLHLDADSLGYALHKVTIFNDIPQTWSSNKLARALTRGKNCHLTVSTTDIVIPPSVSCTLTLPELQGLNKVSLTKRFMIWIIITIIGLASLGLLSYLARIVRRWDAHCGTVESTTGARMRGFTQNWSFIKVILGVGIVTVTFHLMYALFIPIHYTPDSTSYYSFGQGFLQTFSFDAIGLSRTPGYPIFIASTIWLFGEQVQGIILFQHLALAMLGPLTVWFLYPRTNPLFAAMGGLLTGIIPVISVLANVVWTDSLFAVANYLALLLFLHYQPKKHFALVMVGIMVGLATMIRPNGVLTLLLMVGWLFLYWWCSSERTIQSLGHFAISGAALVLGYLVVTTPWYLHFHSKVDRWGLTSMSAKTTDWQTPGSMPEIAAALAVSFQGRANNLTINKPYQIFMRFLYQPGGQQSWGPYTLMPVGYDSRFLGETFRECVRQNPALHLRIFYEAMFYNFFGIYPDPSSLAWTATNLRGAFYTYYNYTPKTIEVKTVNKINSINTLLEQMSYRWHPPQSHLRSTLLWISKISIETRGMITFIALLSVIVILLLAPYRDFILFWIYCIIAGIVPAIISMPIERYVVIIEPITYVLITVLMYALFSLKFRRKNVFTQNI